jgi:putative nucleotidyltransferase with HDIG domain
VNPAPAPPASPGPHPASRAAAVAKAAAAKAAAAPPAAAPGTGAGAGAGEPARPRRRVKLLYQLLAVLLLVGVGPLAISSRKMMQINQGTLESGILTAHTQIVTSTAERVATFVVGVLETLRGMARFQGLSSRVDEAQRSDLLIPFLDSYESLLAVRVVGTDGRTSAEIGRGGAGAWEQLGRADAAAAAAAALRGEEYVGTPFFPPGGAAAAVGFGVPVRDESNRVVAALLAIVSLADLQELVARVRVGTTGQAYLVDKRGVLIAHRDLEQVRRRENLSDLEIVGYLQAGQTLGSVPFKDRAGRQMLGAYDLVPHVGWGVVIEELRSEAYRSLDELRRQTVFWVALGLVLAIGIGVSFAQALSRPIRAFAERALAISRGDFKGTISSRSRNEIGQLAETFNHMTKQLDLYDRNMRELFLSTIKSLAAAIDAKDPYTRGHSERVAVYSVAIARELGLDERSLERVQIAALLHDVGKIGIEDAVLRKPSKLTDAEYAIIKRHPVMGASIMQPIRQLKDIIPGMRHHHEALDGSGYPDGLAGGEIPLIARIIAVGDTFDAMTSERLYQKAKDDEFVIQVLLKLSGTRYDPKAVQAFIKAHPKLGRLRAAATAAQPA